MKIILKKAVALVCASAIISFCYPKFGNNISLAETPEMDKSTIVKPIDISDTNGKINRKSSSIDSEAAIKLFTATAYALSGRTKSGLRVKRGIVAADPRVLPLGTKVQITAGEWSGTYLVADTGGVIKGRIVDVWVPNNAEARKFGRQKVTLKIVGR